MTVSIATWNTEWATPGSDRGRRISVILAAAECDVIVATEGVREILPQQAQWSMPGTTGATALNPHDAK